MIKIVFVHLLNDYSGSPKVLSQVIKIVKRHNYEAILYINKGSKGFLSDMDIPTFYFPYRYRNNRFSTLLELIRSQIILFFALFKHKGNSIFYINTLLPIGAAIAGRVYGTKVIYHIHETSVRPHVLKKILHFIARLTSSACIFVSRFLMNAEGFPDTPSICCYNVLDDDFIERSRKHAYMPNPDDFSVLMMCSLKHYKGIPEFLKAAEVLSNCKPISFHLVLNAGRDDIERYFSHTAVPKNTSIYLATKDVHTFYEKASLVMNLSRTDQWIETFGLTLLEAMSYGIPVIGPPVGGPSEIIRTGVNGYMINSYDTKELCDRILELSSDPKLCLQLSEAARNTAKQFSPDVFEANILNVIDCVINPMQPV